MAIRRTGRSRGPRRVGEGTPGAPGGSRLTAQGLVGAGAGKLVWALGQGLWAPATRSGACRVLLQSLEMFATRAVESGEKGPQNPTCPCPQRASATTGLLPPISQMRKLRPREGQEAASLSSRSPEWGEPADPAGEEGRGLAWVAEQGFHSENKPARPSQGPRKRPGQGRHSRGLKGSLGR